MMFPWLPHVSGNVGCGTHMRSPAFVPKRVCAACSAIPRHAWSRSSGAKKKTLCGCCGRAHSGWYDRKTRRVRDLSCGDTRVYLEFEVRRVHCRSCGKVKRERLDFLADNPFYTKRFAYFVGRRWRQSSIQDVAKELKLDWHTVKELDKQYMRANSNVPACQVPRSLASTRCRFASATPIASWSAT
jgi:transposase